MPASSRRDTSSLSASSFGRYTDDATSMTTSTPPASVCMGDSPSGLPTEVFVAAATFLPPADLVYAAQVCRSWRSALHSTPHLWHSLVLYIDHDSALEKAIAWSQRTGRCLERVTLVQSTSPQHAWDLDSMGARLERLRNAIITHDGGAHIQAVEFWALQPDVYAIGALDLFCACFLPIDPHSQWLNSVTSVMLRTCFSHLFLSKCFLFGLSRFQAVTLLNESQPNRPHTPRQPQLTMADFARYLKGEPPVDNLSQPSQCNTLVLSGSVFLLSLQMPAFPNLTHLHLRMVWMGRQFYFLLQSAPALEVLAIEHLSLNLADLKETSVADFIDSPDLDAEDLKQYPELQTNTLITLPVLEELKVTGTDTPAFWQHDAQFDWLPDIIMPRLVQATFISVASLDDESTTFDFMSPRRRPLMVEDWPEALELSDDDEDLLGALQPDALWSLCSTSKHLTDLAVPNCPLTDQSLMEAVRPLERLERLSIAQTDVGDLGIDSLAVLAPTLIYLDIRGTRTAARTAAKLVEGLREHGGRLQALLMDDPGPFYESESDMVNHVAYQWLDWVGVLVDWVEPTRTRKSSKSVWKPAWALAQEQQQRYQR